MPEKQPLTTPIIDTNTSPIGPLRTDINFEAIIANPPYTTTQQARRATSFNLNPDVFQRFKETCVANRQSMSHVIEQFMRDYADTH